MGLLSIIKKQKAKDHEIRVLMLGLDNAGKTTIVTSILGLPISTVSPTMGFEIKTIPYNGFNLNIWDIGGQTTLRGFWGNYFDKTDIVVWVIDCLSLERLNESFTELKQKVIEQDRLTGIKLLILINKVDLYGKSSTEDGEVKSLVENIASLLKLHEHVPDKSSWEILPVSGKSGYGIHDVLNWLTLQNDL